MSFMPDFIQDYHDHIFDDKGAKELRDLATEYNQKLDRLDKSIDALSANTKMFEELTGKTKDLNVAKLYKTLKNEYKKKAMEIARPHIEDKELFEQIAKKHAPDPELEYDPGDKKITESQERTVQLLEKSKESSQSNEHEVRQDQTELKSEAKEYIQEKDDQEIEKRRRAERLAEIKRQLQQNKSMTLDREH